MTCGPAIHLILVAIECNDTVTVREGMGRRAGGGGIARRRVNVKGSNVTERLRIAMGEGGSGVRVCLYGQHLLKTAPP